MDSPRGEIWTVLHTAVVPPQRGIPKTGKIPQSWHKARRFGSHARLPPAVKTSVSWLKNLLCSGYFLLELWQAGQRQEELKGSVEHLWRTIRNMHPAPSSPVASRTAQRCRQGLLSVPISLLAPFCSNAYMALLKSSSVTLLDALLLATTPLRHILVNSFCFQGTRNIFLGSAPCWGL